jgi:hypothetical protein
MPCGRHLYGGWAKFHSDSVPTEVGAPHLASEMWAFAVARSRGRAAHADSTSTVPGAPVE